MVWRSRVMGTRSSRSSARRGAGDGGGAAGAGAGQEFRDSARTSPLKTWPRLPDPSTTAGIKAMIGGDLGGGGRGRHFGQGRCRAAGAGLGGGATGLVSALASAWFQP